MNGLIKLGLVAALALSSASGALAVEVKAGAQAGASTDAAAGATTDATTTGSVSAETYGSLIASVQTSQAPDLTAFNETSTINCVKVSGLQEDATNNAAALDTAVTTNKDSLATLHTSIQSNTAFLEKVKTSCAVAELDATAILGVKVDASGAFIVYLDDRAMAGTSTDASGAANSSLSTN